MRALPALAFALIPVTASASGPMDCFFTKLCTPDAGCKPIDGPSQPLEEVAGSGGREWLWAPHLGGWPGQAVSEPGGDVPLIILFEPQIGSDGALMLSVSENGAAILTHHGPDLAGDGLSAATRIGTCEGR